MKVIDRGHKYKLHTLDGDTKSYLTFVKREGLGYPGNVGSYPGTTCQEVLRALIDRLEYLNNQIPCWQNQIARLCCIIALWLFEYRHSRRKGRVLKVLPWRVLDRPICSQCGHIECLEHKTTICEE